MKKILTALLLSVALHNLAWGVNTGAKATSLTSATRDWFDQQFRTLLAEAHRPRLPGAVITVVEGDQVLFQKGYGLADRERRRPFSPETTVRAASITKTVTALAILQLSERGLLKLDDNILTFMPWLRTNADAKAVTISHLLTHTGGYDETSFRYYSASEGQSLESVIRGEIAKRVEAPGTRITYSNFGFLLLGRIVEVVSGQSYDTYVQENILTPLQMRQSSVRQPIPQSLRENLARSYFFDQGFVPIEPQYRFDISAGGLTTTASDMSHYLMALLSQGVYFGASVLQPSTVDLMKAQQFTNHPALPGWTYGFSERFENGHRVLMHGGNFRDAASLVVLVPDKNLGFFLSFNSPVELSSGGDPREEFFLAFMSQFCPPETPSVEQAPDFLPADERFQGTYRYTRYIHRGIEKALKLDGSLVHVSVSLTSGGVIRVAYPLDVVPPTEWIQESPLVFQRVDKKDEKLVFRQDSQGTIVGMDGTLISPFSTERIAWYETLGFQAGVFLLGLTVFVVGVLGMLVSDTRRLLFRRNPPRILAPLDQFRRGSRVLAILGVSVVLALVVAQATLTGDGLVIKVVLVGLSWGFLVGVGWNLWLVVRSRTLTVPKSLGWWWFRVVLVTSVVFCWFLSYWNTFWI